jgi:Rieske Fe-S protein
MATETDATLPEKPTPRRSFLATCGKTGLAIVALLGAVWAVGYNWPPLRKWFRIRRITFQRVAAVEDMSPGQWKSFSFETVDWTPWKTVRRDHTVWVRRDRDRPEAFHVLSSVCSHAGCRIAWRADKSLFICPCHGGTFDADGALKKGPPQRSMDPLEFRVENGQLLVRWEDFQVGSPDRVRVDLPI